MMCPTVRIGRAEIVLGHAQGKLMVAIGFSGTRKSALFRQTLGCDPAQLLAKSVGFTQDCSR